MVFCRRDTSTRGDKSLFSEFDNCRIRWIQAGSIESVIQWGHLKGSRYQGWRNANADTRLSTAARPPTAAMFRMTRLLYATNPAGTRESTLMPATKERSSVGLWNA